MKIILRLLYIVLIIPYMALGMTVLPAFHWLRTGDSFVDIVNYYVIYLPESVSNKINNIGKGK